MTRKGILNTIIMYWSMFLKSKMCTRILHSPFSSPGDFSWVLSVIQIQYSPEVYDYVAKDNVFIQMWYSQLIHHLPLLGRAMHMFKTHFKLKILSRCNKARIPIYFVLYPISLPGAKKTRYKISPRSAVHEYDVGQKL